MSTFDLLVRGAALVDGSGAPPFAADLGVRDRRIAAIGAIPDSAAAARVVDGSGKVLCPGFIDVHTHSDLSLLLDGRGESKLFQGVTTEVTGNCSLSAFPLNLIGDRRELHQDHLARIGDRYSAQLTWTDLEGYERALQERGGVALNVAAQVGHGTVRVAVMGVDDRRPRPDELTRMERLVDEMLDQGAFGLSTGLTLVPSAYADTDEVVALAAVAARRGAHYATHARAGDQALSEAVEIGRRSGARVQFSHVAINHPEQWGRHAELIAQFEQARANGVDIVYDVYPYAASSSGLTQYLPAWVQAGGSVAMAERLRDASTRSQARAELALGWGAGIPWRWDRVVVSRSGDQAGGEDVGKTLQELADEAGIEPAELVLRLCEERGNTVHVVLFYRTEEDMRAFLRHPLAVVGSDGSALAFECGEEKPHPRNYGAAVRILGRYVRELALLDVATAIHKMTGLAAERMGIVDRGLLREGAAADLVLFDPDRVADRATFADPCQSPLGVELVTVNGEVAVEQGRQTEARAGRVLRKRSRT